MDQEMFARRLAWTLSRAARTLLGGACVLAWLWPRPAAAAVVTWSGGSGNWDTATNWSNGLVPTAADDVTISGAVTVTLPASRRSAASLSVGSGVTLTGSIVDLSVTGDLDLQSGSVITVDWKGYAGGAGANSFQCQGAPGGGPGGGARGDIGNGGGGGAGHGGAGGTGGGTSSPGATYDDLLNPTQYGSGGGGGSYYRCGGGSYGGAGGKGGGVVILDAGKTLTINGAITANGRIGFNGESSITNSGGGGGGSGGSVNLRAATLAVGGLVRAEGGGGLTTSPTGVMPAEAAGAAGSCTVTRATARVPGAAASRQAPPAT